MKDESEKRNSPDSNLRLAPAYGTYMNNYNNYQENVDLFCLTFSQFMSYKVVLTGHDEGAIGLHQDFVTKKLAAESDSGKTCCAYFFVRFKKAK